MLFGVPGLMVLGRSAGVWVLVTRNPGRGTVAVGALYGTAARTSAQLLFQRFPAAV